MILVITVPTTRPPSFFKTSQHPGFQHSAEKAFLLLVADAPQSCHRMALLLKAMEQRLCEGQGVVMIFSVSAGIDESNRTKVGKCDEDDEVQVKTAYRPSDWRPYA